MLCDCVQIRSLAGAGWQQDRQRFAEYAGAVLASARAALVNTAAGDESVAKKDLAASRMLLQSIVKAVRSLVGGGCFAHTLRGL